MRRLVAGLLVLIATGAVSAPAGAQVERLISYDPRAGELPEGVAVDKRGTVYVSFPGIGQLRAVDQRGAERIVAVLPAREGFGPLGLAVDAPGNVFVAVSTFDPETTGIYRVTPAGNAARLPGTSAIGFPNGVAFDKRGTLYVTDTIVGAVWRIPRGGEAEVWVQHPLLVGDGSAPLPFPIGANGIAYRQGVLYVANTELGSIVAVPVLSDGSPGPARQLVRAPALGGADGLALGVRGNLYVAVIGQSTIVRVSPDGTQLVTLADASDGLDFLSSVAFGTSDGQRRTLYGVNFAIGGLFDAPPGHGPALLALQTEEPGQPLP